VTFLLLLTGAKKDEPFDEVLEIVEDSIANDVHYTGDANLTISPGTGWDLIILECFIVAWRALTLGWRRAWPSGR
jgi:hypothetical protein